MTEAQVIDYTASAFTIVQVILVGRKNTTGWLFGILGASLYVILGVRLNLFGLVVLESILVVLYGFNFWRWRRDVKRVLGGRVRRG